MYETDMAYSGPCLSARFWEDACTTLGRPLEDTLSLHLTRYCKTGEFACNYRYANYVVRFRHIRRYYPQLQLPFTVQLPTSTCEGLACFMGLGRQSQSRTRACPV